MSRHRQNGFSFVPKKILTSAPREARGGLKETADKRITTRLSFYPHSVLLLSVSFCQSPAFLGKLYSKPFQLILDIVGLSQAELWLTGWLTELLLLFDEIKPKENKGSSKHLRFC